MQQCLTANSNLFFEVELAYLCFISSKSWCSVHGFFSQWCTRCSVLFLPDSSQARLFFFNRTTLLCHLFYRSGLMSRVSRNLSSFIGILMICYSLHVENLVGFFFCSVWSDSNRSLATFRLQLADRSSGIYFSLVNRCVTLHMHHLMCWWKNRNEAFLVILSLRCRMLNT